MRRIRADVNTVALAPMGTAIQARRSVKTDPTRLRRAGFNPPRRASMQAPRSVETGPT